MTISLAISAYWNMIYCRHWLNGGKKFNQNSISQHNWPSTYERQRIDESHDRCWIQTYIYRDRNTRREEFRSIIQRSKPQAWFNWKYQPHSRKRIIISGGFIVGFDEDRDDIFDRQIQFIQESGISLPIVRSSKRLLVLNYTSELKKKIDCPNHLHF